MYHNIYQGLVPGARSWETTGFFGFYAHLGKDGEYQPCYNHFVFGSTIVNPSHFQWLGSASQHLSDKQWCLSPFMICQSQSCKKILKTTDLKWFLGPGSPTELESRSRPLWLALAAKIPKNHPRMTKWRRCQMIDHDRLRLSTRLGDSPNDDVSNIQRIFTETAAYSCSLFADDNIRIGHLKSWEITGEHCNFYSSKLHPKKMVGWRPAKKTVVSPPFAFVWD